MQNFEALDYLIKNNKQNQEGLRKNYYKCLFENMSNINPDQLTEEVHILLDIMTMLQMSLASECVCMYSGFTTTPIALDDIGHSGNLADISALITYPDIPKYFQGIGPIGDIFEDLVRFPDLPDLPDLPTITQEDIKEALNILKQLFVPITKEEYDQIFKETYDSVYK